MGEGDPDGVDDVGLEVLEFVGVALQGEHPFAGRFPRCCRRDPVGDGQVPGAVDGDDVTDDHVASWDLAHEGDRAGRDGGRHGAGLEHDQRDREEKGCCNETDADESGDRSDREKCVAERGWHT